jgi:hypothetical protein
MTCVWLCSRWIIDFGVQSSAMTDTRAKRDNSSNSPNLAAVINADRWLSRET